MVINTLLYNRNFLKGGLNYTIKTECKLHAVKYIFVNLFPCENCQRSLINHMPSLEKIISFAPKHKKQIFHNIEIVNPDIFW